MKTLSDLQDAITSSGVGSATLSLAANGKAMASATFPPAFVSQHQWGDTIEEALNKLFAAAPVVTDDDDEDLL